MTTAQNPEIYKVPNFIGGRLEESTSVSIEEIPNPATGEAIALLPHSSPEEVDRAVASAKEALPGWAATPVPDRAQILFRFKRLLEEHTDELSALITQENGKTLSEARGEVRRGIEVVDYACGAPSLLMGGKLQEIARGIDQELNRFPVGVVAGITPFNFPAMIPLWMAPIALMCGNAFVLKPSQRTPLCSIRLAEFAHAAGFPDGVLSVVHGAADAVKTLVSHPDVAAVSFVGSASVARYVYELAALNGKRVQALGGAKNHLVVMEDADLEQTVDTIIASAFGNAGQRCLSGSVVVGVGSVADPLLSKLSEAAAALRLGPGDRDDTDMGPVIRRERKQELIAHINAAASQALLVSDGRTGCPEEGFYLGPTILDRVTPAMDVWKEELFGPVLANMRATDLDEALDLINQSEFGNQASIFTASGKYAREFQRRADAGMLGVNIGVAAAMAFFPFTGWKRSFLGDLHATGADAVRFYTRQKIVTTRWF